MEHISDEERRRRIAVRHRLHPAARAETPEEAASMTVLHATEPAAVYLSLATRIDGLRRAEVDRAFYTDRTLVKQLAMRRTLFVFPRDLLPAARASASARVARTERNRLVKDVEASGIAARARLARGSRVVGAHPPTRGRQLRDRPAS